MGHDVIALGGYSRQGKQIRHGHAFPGLVQGAPLGYAVKVGLQNLPGQFGKGLPIHGYLFLYESEHPELPSVDVNLWFRTVGEHRELGGQELPGRHTLSVALVGRCLHLVRTFQAPPHVGE